MLKYLRICIGLLFISTGAWAQTCAIPGFNGPNATINAVVNSYFPGTADANSGVASITVGARRGAAVNIAPGDLLLIIQMQSAVINSSNTNQYGDGAGSGANEDNAGDPARGSSSNIAGQYEFAIATNAVPAAGGTVNLSASLTYGYVNAATSPTQGQQRFQVIRVPQYSSANVAAATIDVTHWDGTSGGVFVIDVAGALTFTAGSNINVAQRGFRGGGGINQGITCTASGGTLPCTEYRSPNANIFGAFKGEGIAGSPAFMYRSFNAGTDGSATGADTYPNGDRGRGAPGNAGGGANQHNGGGGGGGNGGIGGFGGNTWNASTASFAGGRYGGHGGANNYNSSTRIIMGGGGGAGDTNDAGTAHGGSGGGIVMIRAGTITGSGTINVNGAPGLPGGGTDGSGAGGAGGTIWITTGNGALPGTLLMTANGGAGANSGPMGGSAETDGPGGGGGGGVLITNSTGGNFAANGGAAGTMNNSTSSVCGTTSPNPQCFATAGGIGVTTTVAVPVAGTGVRVGHECLPDMRVTKATGTRIINSATGATASYTINVQNFGGGARNVHVQDTTLPPGWTLASPATYSYSLSAPIAANNLPTAGEAGTADGAASFPLINTVGTAPGTVAAAGANSLAWRNFFLAPLKAGIPSSMTISFVVNIPNTTTVACYHNSAGLAFLDSTRLAAATTRMVTSATNNAANRAGAPYAANTTYQSGFTTTIAGFNYSGLPNGPTGEDVCLQPDLSIVKTANAASLAAGQTLNYTLTARNNGRTITDVTFTTNQATTQTNAVAASQILAGGAVRVTDTFPAGLTVTTPFAGTGWSCTQTGQLLDCSRTTIPLVGSTSLPAITGTVRVLNTSCPGPITNTATIGSVGNGFTDTNVVNNSSSVSATLDCNANLSITKTNTVTAVTAGGTTSYLITITNTGPASADGAIARDIPSAGLSCTVANCVATGGSPVAAQCPTPAPASWSNLLTVAGVPIPSLPPGGVVRFTVNCNVTATGQP